MINNTVSKIPTRFLRGCELIIEAREKYNICSENYTYPKITFGDDQSEYYAEIWTDGMDWNIVYWLIESNYLEHEGKVLPLIFFDNIDECANFNKRDLDDILYNLLWFRRNENINIADVFCYITKTNEVYKQFTKCTFKHASQKLVTFYINTEIINNIFKNK